MKGSNKLYLNEATIIEAVDYWLRNKIWNANESAPAVKAVKFESSHLTGDAFIVSIQTDEAKSPELR